jgi:hypothetical protein
VSVHELRKRVTVALIVATLLASPGGGCQR